MDPYEILGVAPDADDEAVRKAYLDLVRRFSPDHDPEAFKRISTAYEALKDEKSRLRHYLFDRETPGDSPFQAFLQHSATVGKRQPPNHEQFKEFLRKCAKK
jgi:curved DNA-binding protein CbpA